MPWEEKENEIRHRIKEPGLFQQDSFASIDIEKGVRFVIGKLQGEKNTTVQAVRFDNQYFTLAQAKKWVEDHKDRFEQHEESNMKKGELIDFFETQIAKENIDVENRTIKNVLILQEKSANGRVYPRDVLEKAIPLYEGARAFINHTKPGLSADRDIKDTIGKFTNPRHINGQIRADLQLLKNQSVFITDLAEMNIQGIGFSHHAKGEVVKKDDIEEVKSISKVISVDLVIEPATTRTVFEDINRKEQDEMDMKEFTKELTVEKLKTDRPDLVEQIEKTVAEKSKEEMDKLRAEIEKKDKTTLIKENIKKAGITFTDKKSESELVEFYSTKTKEDIDSFFKFYPKGKAESTEKDIDEKLNADKKTVSPDEDYIKAAQG